ncbi:hypothetical protein AMELA_G00205110 [Ameiurus melas]|uniref:Uncharacterized protein n=1 Tax=Ameiurus melas TaxID=219545 RepID=A0A7J6A2T4_AMEME|nr:hypothetical protein AMELA_G00205110 [Ameiurus melas]
MGTFDRMFSANTACKPNTCYSTHNASQSAFPREPPTTQRHTGHTAKTRTPGIVKLLAARLRV